MNREEKNRQTRRRIMDSALKEFSEKGYAAGSVNAVCSADGVSKGIIYHYFNTKDDLYLACVEECFLLLSEYLKTHAVCQNCPLEEKLECYFSARTAFFQQYPVYRRIFCEAVISPVSHLRDEIQKLRQDFDALNVEILGKLLSNIDLRPHITKAEVIEFFRQYQDFINAKYQMTDASTQKFEMWDDTCRRALDILLYGVIERKEEKNVH